MQSQGQDFIHMFQPSSSSCVAVKKCSADKDFYLIHDLLKQNTYMKPSIHDYVSFLYDQKWWIGIVLEINIEEGDVLVKFMGDSPLSRAFYFTVGERVYCRRRGDGCEDLPLARRLQR